MSAGDLLLGSGSDSSFSREGFNDLGQIAFWAALADGRQAIVLASSVPEPAAAAFFLAFLALLARVTRTVKFAPAPDAPPGPSRRRA